MLWGETERPEDRVGGWGCNSPRMIREDHPMQDRMIEQRQEGGDGGSQVPFWERTFQSEAREVQKP